MDSNLKNLRKIQNALGGDKFANKLLVRGEFISPENIDEILDDTNEFLRVDDLDFFSLDIDTYDYFIIASLMKTKHRPLVICVEYNAKFPPTIEIKGKHFPNGWEKDDYMGASILTFVNIMRNDYDLVACSASGVNVFFVRKDVSGVFKLTLLRLFTNLPDMT